MFSVRGNLKSSLTKPKYSVHAFIYFRVPKLARKLFSLKLYWLVDPVACSFYEIVDQSGYESIPDLNKLRSRCPGIAYVPYAGTCSVRLSGPQLNSSRRPYWTCVFNCFVTSQSIGRSYTCENRDLCKKKKTYANRLFAFRFHSIFRGIVSRLSKYNLSSGIHTG